MTSGYKKFKGVRRIGVVWWRPTFKHCRILCVIRSSMCHTGLIVSSECSQGVLLHLPLKRLLINANRMWNLVSKRLLRSTLLRKPGIFFVCVLGLVQDFLLRGRLDLKKILKHQ